MIVACIDSACSNTLYEYGYVTEYETQIGSAFDVGRIRKDRSHERFW